MRKLPLTVNELLNELDELIPEPAIRPGDSPTQIMFDAGRRSVVLELFERLEGAVAPALRAKRGLGRVRRGPE